MGVLAVKHFKALSKEEVMWRAPEYSNNTFRLSSPGTSTAQCWHVVKTGSNRGAALAEKYIRFTPGRGCTCTGRDAGRGPAWLCQHSPQGQSSTVWLPGPPEFEHNNLRDGCSNTDFSEDTSKHHEKRPGLDDKVRPVCSSRSRLGWYPCRPGDDRVSICCSSWCGELLPGLLLGEEETSDWVGVPCLTEVPPSFGSVWAVQCRCLVHLGWRRWLDWDCQTAGTTLG